MNLGAGLRLRQFYDLGLGASLRERQLRYLGSRASLGLREFRYLGSRASLGLREFRQPLRELGHLPLGALLSLRQPTEGCVEFLELSLGHRFSQLLEHRPEGVGERPGSLFAQRRTQIFVDSIGVHEDGLRTW